MNDESPVTYVTVMYTGEYDDKETSIIYAGQSYGNALKAAAEYHYSELRGGSIEYWQDGKMIREEEVR